MIDIKNIVYQFISQQKLAVVSTISPDNNPEAALVGIAVTENFDIIFDTVKTSRKYANLRQNPKVAVVIGWDSETTVQYEGEAQVLENDADSQKLREVYYNAYPDGRERTETWPNLVHIRITPKWLRYSKFDDPVVMEEMVF